MAVVNYFKYIQIKNFKVKQDTADILVWLNHISFYMGLIADIEVSLVANFQKCHNNFSSIIHGIGANTAFGIGFLYFVSQVIHTS